MQKFRVLIVLGFALLPIQALQVFAGGGQLEPFKILSITRSNPNSKLGQQGAVAQIQGADTLTTGTSELTRLALTTPLANWAQKTPNAHEYTIQTGVYSILGTQENIRAINKNRSQLFIQFLKSSQEPVEIREIGGQSFVYLSKSNKQQALADFIDDLEAGNGFIDEFMGSMATVVHWANGGSLVFPESHAESIAYGLSKKAEEPQEEVLSEPVDSTPVSTSSTLRRRNTAASARE